MTHNYNNGVLTLTNEDGGVLIYPYNPETQVPFSSEEEALNYAYSRPMYFVAPPTLDELKMHKSYAIKNAFNASKPVTLNGITYNGGDSSASAISGAVTLAQALGETTVKLWDYSNVVREYSFEEAIAISAQIGKVYRDTMIERQTLLTQVANATSKEELEGIVV